MCIIYVCVSVCLSERLRTCLLCNCVHAHVLCLDVCISASVCVHMYVCVSRRLRGIAWVCMRECGGRELL